MDLRATEVAIIGGGPAGSVAALMLARAGRRVVLLEAAAESAEPRVGEALPPAARPLLADLGLLDRLREGSHLPCPGNLSVWGSLEPRQHDFFRDPHGVGWHLDRSEFDASLRAAAEEAGAHVRLATRAHAVERDADGWRLALEAGRRLGDGGAGGREELRCSWVIDATGRGGALAGRLGSQRQRDDPMIALVARFRPAESAPPDRDARTLIEAVADGWWYSARLPREERLVAFHTDPDLTDVATLRKRGVYLERLRRAPHLSALLAAHGYRPEARPRGADAGSSRLEPAAGEGWLAIGDAALALDPLSSQGLFTACYTGLRGAEAVVSALDGDHRALERYRSRLRDIYRAYLEHRAHYYGLETRWSEGEFWRRRIQRSVTARREIPPALSVG